MKTNKTRKTLLLIIVSLLFIISISSVFLYFSKDKKEEIIPEEIIEVIQEDTIEEEISEEEFNYKEIYQENAAYSNYYKGNIIFKSGIINEPFVQYSNNEYFLRRDFRTNKYSIMGTVFMDFECNLDSQNITLYGHNAFSSYDAGLDEDGNKIDNDTLGFTSLKYLDKKEFYEENNTVYLILENEIRTYKIVAAYNVPLGTDMNSEYYLCPPYEALYYLADFSDDYFETYKDKILELEYFSTGYTYSNSDRYLTLQTCIEGNDFAREIVLCKEINREELK